MNHPTGKPPTREEFEALEQRLKKVEDNQAAIEGGDPRIHRGVRRPSAATSWGNGAT